MAIDTYAKLQSEIADTLNRADLLTDVDKYSSGQIEGAIKRGIRKAELRAQRELKARERETSTTLTFSSSTATYTLPTDFAQIGFVFLSKSPLKVLTLTSIENLYSEFPSQALGEPEKVAIWGNQLYARPIANAGFTVPFFYYQKIPTLTTSNTTNWLLDNYPDVYLYASCIELMPHLMDDQRIQVWKGAYDEAVRLINEDSAAAKWSGALQQSALPVQIVV